MHFQRHTCGEEWAGAELRHHPMEVRAKNFRQPWFREQPDPREPHRRVPFKTAVLVKIRFSCCNKGFFPSPLENGEWNFAFLS